MNEKVVLKMNQTLTLNQLLSSVKKLIDECFYDRVWIEAELSDWKVNGFSGHAYGELVEHTEAGKKVASCRFTCWKTQAAVISHKFEQATGERLKSGLKVKLAVKVTFSQQYGFALNILDIDPAFTLGKLVQNIQDILNQVEVLGIAEKNKSLEAPFDFFKVGVISSPTAAGLEDFNQVAGQLEDDGLCQFIYADAIMQGESCAGSVEKALRTLSKETELDCVIILRGGGSILDLASFNDLSLTKTVCEFPIPIFCAIGHDRDQCVLDYVSHSSFGTPSKAAHFIEATVYSNAQKIIHFKDQIEKKVIERTQQAQEYCQFLQQRVVNQVKYQLERSSQSIELLLKNIHTVSKQHIGRAEDTVIQLLRVVVANGVQSTLDKGYSIALDDKGKTVQSAQQANSSGVRSLTFKDGEYYL